MENSKKPFRTKLSSCAKYFFHNTPKASLVFFVLGILALVVRVVCRASQSFSDFFVRYIAGPVRFILAKISSVIPISLAEILIWLLPFVIALVIFLAVRYSREKRSAFRYAMTLLSIAALVYFLFVFTLASGYHTSTVADDFDIERKDITALELKQTAEWLVENANKYSAEFANQGNKASEMPFSWSGLNDNLNASYKKLNAEYDFIFNFSTRTKPVLISSLMSYTGILGVYSFFTGEANVNTAYPDYTTVFTAAPGVLKEFEKTPYAARLKATGVITSYICPLMYMNNPLSGKMPVITSSNKLRTYTTARDYTDEEILEQITKGGK